MKICNHCRIEKSLDNFSIFVRSDNNKIRIRSQCKECYNLCSKQNYDCNPQKKLVQNKRWRDNNLEHSAEWQRNKEHTDVQYKLRRRLRTRLRQAIRGISKIGSSVTDLGCSIPELKEHIEKQFKKGMTWSNWSTDGWHVDHVKPLYCFDLTDRKQFLEANHYTNLQPLWWYENLKKASKINE